MADMGTKEASEKWGVSQSRVQKWCRTCGDKRITQDKKGSPWHIPKNYPNPFKK
ncbi:MAG: helix-turn-helix domain-containing protein [Ruminococcus sp.]|nr:helix-turn-helix domain-containing protein [Ruminococcus sp.]